MNLMHPNDSGIPILFLTNDSDGSGLISRDTSDCSQLQWPFTLLPVERDMKSKMMEVVVLIRRLQKYSFRASVQMNNLGKVVSVLAYF